MAERNQRIYSAKADQAGEQGRIGRFGVCRPTSICLLPMVRIEVEDALRVIVLTCSTLTSVLYLDHGEIMVSKACLFYISLSNIDLEPRSQARIHGFLDDAHPHASVWRAL